MERWIPKPSSVPAGDGAFERFLSAAIAAIITIMFSWRLLDRLTEEENEEQDRNSASDYSDASSRTSSESGSVSHASLLSSPASVSQRAASGASKLPSTNVGRRQLPAIPPKRGSQARANASNTPSGGLTYKVTDLKPFIRVPVDLPLCGEIGEEETEKDRERKRKGDILPDGDGENSRGIPHAKESRLSDFEKTNSSATRTTGDGNNIDLLSPGAHNNARHTPEVGERDQYTKHDALPVDGDSKCTPSECDAANREFEREHGTGLPGYDVNNPVDSTIIQVSSSIQYSTPIDDRFSEELVDSSNDDIAVEVDSGGEDRFIDVSGESGSGREEFRLPIDDDEYYPYPLREVNDRVRIVGRSRDDTDIDYNSYVLDDDEDEFYITSSISRPNHRSPGSLQRHFSDDYEDDDEEEDEHDIRGVGPREYDMEEEMYCSMLEPIMEEDSDDISTSGSEVDRVSLGKGVQETSFEESGGRTTHFSVPSLTSAPLRYSLSSSSSSLPSSFHSPPLTKRNLPSSSVDTDDLPSLSRSVGRNCDLDKTPLTPHLYTTSFSATAVTTTATHVNSSSGEDARETLTKPDYRDEDNSTHLAFVNTKDIDSESGGETVFDRSRLEQYKIQLPTEYYQNIRNFGSSVDGDNSYVPRNSKVTHGSPTHTAEVESEQTAGRPPVTDNNNSPFRESSDRDILKNQCVDQTFAQTFSSTIQADEFSNSESDESVQTVIARHFSSDSSGNNSNNSPVHSVTARLSPVKSVRPLSDSIIYKKLAKGENPEASAFDRGRIVSEGGAVSFEEEQTKQIEEGDGFDLRAYKSYDNLAEDYIQSQAGEEGTFDTPSGDLSPNVTALPDYVSHSGDRVGVTQGEIDKTWNSIGETKNLGQEEVFRLRDRTQHDSDSIVRLDGGNNKATSGGQDDSIDNNKQTALSVVKPSGSRFEESDSTGHRKNLNSGEFDTELNNDKMDYRSGDTFGKSSFSHSDIDDRYGEAGGGREGDGEEDEDWENHVVETFVIPKTPESHIIRTLQNVKDLLDQKSASSSRSELYHRQGGGALEPMDFDEEYESTCTTTLIEVTGHDAMGFHGDDDEKSGYRASRNALARTDRDLKDRMGFQLDMDEFKMEDYNTESGWPIVRYLEKERAYVDEEGYDKRQDFDDVNKSEEKPPTHNYPAGGFDYPMRSEEYHPSNDEVTTVYVQPTETVYQPNDERMVQQYDTYDKDNENPTEYMNVKKETEFPATLMLETYDEEPGKFNTVSHFPPKSEPLHTNQQELSQISSLPKHPFATEKYGNRTPLDARTSYPQDEKIIPQRSVSVEESPVLTMPPPSAQVEKQTFPAADDRQTTKGANTAPYEVEEPHYHAHQSQDLPKHSTLSQQTQPPHQPPADSGFHAFFRGIPSLGRQEDEGYEDFVRQISEADEGAQHIEPDISSPSFPGPLGSAILSGNLASPCRNQDQFVFPGSQSSLSAAPKSPALETSSPLDKESKPLEGPVLSSNVVPPSPEAKDMRGYNFGVRKSSTCSVLNDESNNVLNASFDDSEMLGMALEKYDSEPGFAINRSRSRDSMSDSPRGFHGERSSFESPTGDMRAGPLTKTYTPRSAPTVSTEPSLDVVLESPSPKSKELPSPNLKEVPSVNTRLHARSPITTFSYVPVEESPRITRVPDAFGDAAVEITSSAVPPSGPRAPVKRGVDEPKEERRQVAQIETQIQPPTKYHRQETSPVTEQRMSHLEVNKPQTRPVPSSRGIPREGPQIQPILQDDRKFEPVGHSCYRPEDQRGRLDVSDEQIPNDTKHEEEEKYDSRGDENGEDNKYEVDNEEEEEEESDEEDEESDDDDEDDDDEEEEGEEEEEEEEEVEREYVVNDTKKDDEREKTEDTRQEIQIEVPVQKTKNQTEAIAIPNNRETPLKQMRNFSYSLESGEDVYPHDSSSCSPRNSPVMSSDSASAFESSHHHTPVTTALSQKPPLATSPSSIITTSVIQPSSIKGKGSSWAHSQFIPYSGYQKPRTLKELKKKYKPYKSVLTQEPTSPTPRPAPFQLPEQFVTPSRMKVLYSRDKFLSEQNLQNSGSMMEGEFETRKTALLSQQSPDATKERRYTPHAKLQSQYNSQEQLQRLKKMIRSSNRGRSESDLNVLHDHECLHENCILTEEGRRDILDKSLSIDNLHVDLALNLRKLYSESDAGALGDEYFPETESDLYDLTFPMQNYNSLERPASMSELRHASDYSIISGAASNMETMSTSGRASTGKGRFAQRHYKKSKSLCTLETDLDDDAFDLNTTDEEGMKRVPSVHELRISKSLQKLNVPDWYKSSSLSKSGSCLLKYGSSSTMSSFQFSPSLISSPCTTPGTSSNVVIKTRVMTPTSARNLRSPRFPSSAPTTPSADQSSKSVRLPSDKYRTQEKPKSLMPIPIVPFDKIRAMFEKEKPKEKKKAPSSSKDIQASSPPTSPTNASTSPPTLSPRPPNTLALNDKKEDDDDVDIDDMPVPKIIVSPTEPHVKSILKRSNQDKRYSDIQEAVESEEDPSVIRPVSAQPSQSMPASSIKDSPSIQPQMSPVESYQKPVNEEMQPAPQVQRQNYASPPTKIPTIQVTEQGTNKRTVSPKNEVSPKKETPPKAASKKKGADDSKQSAPVAKPRGFNFFKSLRSFSSSSSDEGNESKGRKSPGSSIGGSSSPKQSPNSSYDSSGFPASTYRKVESPEHRLAPVAIPPSQQAPSKPESSRDPEHLMALAATPKNHTSPRSSQMDEAPTVRVPEISTVLESAPQIRPPAISTPLEEGPPLRAQPHTAYLDETPTIRPPTSNAQVEIPTTRPSVEESHHRLPEVQPTPPVPSSRPPAYETNLDDTLDKIERRLQQPDNAAPPRKPQQPENAAPPKQPEKKRWIPKSRGFRLSKSSGESSKPNEKKKELTPDDQSGKESNIHAKFEVNEMSYEPRRFRSSRSSGLNDSIVSEDAYGRASYHSPERPYGDLDRSHESRASMSSAHPRDLDQPVRRPSEDSTRSFPREDRIQGRAATRDLDRSGVRLSNRSLDKGAPPDRERTWRPRDLDRRPDHRDRDYDRRDIQDLETREPPRESGRRSDGLRELEREPFRGPDRREHSREPFDADRRPSRDRGDSNRDSIGSARDLDRSRRYSDRSDNLKGSNYADEIIGNNRHERVEEKSQPKGRWQPKPKETRDRHHYQSDSASERSMPHTNGAPSPYRYPVEGSAFSSSRPNTQAGLSTPPSHRRMDTTPKGSEGVEPSKNMRRE